MLVIISDLHLTDGTSGETIKAGAFSAFRERLRDLAYDASKRADGKYKPIEELHLILLGDILDVIRSAKWLDEGPGAGVRPWDDPQSQPFIAKVGDINSAILQTNADSLAVLKSLNDGKTITLPPATQDGKPATVSREPNVPDRVPVKVHTHYMVGNHDWFYHLPGQPYDQIRQSVIDAMGLANSSTEPFPHDPNESQAIQAIYEQHRIFARHGDIFDSMNYEKKRAASSLGDAIVIELLNRFPAEVTTKLGNVLPEDCLNGLKEIDNVRPLLVIPIWIDGLLRRTCKNASQMKKVKDIWNDLVDEFLRLDFVKKRDTFSPIDDVDKLELRFKFSKVVSFHTASRLMTWVYEKMRGRDSSYFQNALNEVAFINQKAQYLIYGHTHHHEIVPLDSSYAGDKLFNQMYFNSGTWRRVHELAQLSPKDQEFMGYHVMTYLAFFKDGERKGRPFESWSGSLGV